MNREDCLLANRYGLQIRAALGADAPGLVGLLRPAAASMTVDALAARLDALHRSDACTVLVAIDWGPPTGLVTVHWHPSLAEDLPVAQIDTILVAPDERRRGVGRLLLKAASQVARSAGCGSIRLSCSSDGDGSLHAFCIATGFERTGEVYARPLRKKT